MASRAAEAPASSPVSAIGSSLVTRLASSANSAATKNPLTMINKTETASKPTVMAPPACVLPACVVPAWVQTVGARQPSPRRP